MGYLVRIRHGDPDEVIPIDCDAPGPACLIHRVLCDVSCPRVQSANLAGLRLGEPDEATTIHGYANWLCVRGRYWKPTVSPLVTNVSKESYSVGILFCEE